jgi:hypothetical protein
VIRFAQPIISPLWRQLVTEAFSSYLRVVLKEPVAGEKSMWKTAAPPPSQYALRHNMNIVAQRTSEDIYNHLERKRQLSDPGAVAVP